MWNFMRPTTRQMTRRSTKRGQDEDTKNNKRVALGDITNTTTGPVRQPKEKGKKAAAVQTAKPELTPALVPPSPIKDVMEIDIPGPSRTLSVQLQPPPISVASPEPDPWEAIPHTDIDIGDDVDPQLCRQYVTEIFDYLRETEIKYRPAPDYITTTQRDINAGMRGILVDWLVEVGEEYKLSSETLYLTVSFIDRFLTTVAVVRGKLQLVGVTAMLLASKYEEIYPPGVEEFTYISDNTYTKEEVFAMERQMLDELEFCLSGATAKMFLRRFLKAAAADAGITMLANYLCELSLPEYNYVRYLPSMVAAAAVALALHTFGKEPWNSTLEYYSRQRLDDGLMQACILDLLTTYRNSQKNALKAVTEKYSHSRFYRVSNPRVVVPPVDFPFPPVVPR